MRSYVLLLGGLLLIGLGGSGLFSISHSLNQTSIKGSFRFHGKPVPATEITQGEKSIVGSENISFDNSIQGIQEEFRPLITVGKTYIHTELPDLEYPLIPDRIEIPSINLVAPIVIADFNLTEVQEETFGQWVAPSKFAAGWHPDSALLGKKGNTVINGHHNAYGEVFGNLVDVQIGDLIIIMSGNKELSFIVANRMILTERFQSVKVRLENARWLAHTDDIRLTLVTCYPEESNTHRLILVARPLDNK